VRARVEFIYNPKGMLRAIRSKGWKRPAVKEYISTPKPLYNGKSKWCNREVKVFCSGLQIYGCTIAENSEADNIPHCSSLN